ncbi:Concanavalin A-like lectin/glucanases superfamily, partial [uncultured Caudovirales phage]
MSRLHDKINSYAIETGIELDQAYSLPPTQTGTATDNNSAAWALIGGLSPTYQSTVGPLGGSGSWKFNVPAGGTAFSRVRTTSSTIVSALNDFNVSTGFWFKWNSFPTVNDVSGTVPVLVWNPLQTMGVGIDIGWSTTLNKFVYVLRYKAAPVYLEGTSDPLPTTEGWHYWAIRRSANPGVYEFYLDGQLVYTSETITSSSTTSTNFVFGLANPSPSVDLNINISNIYIAPYSTIDATDITEIYDVGITTLVTADPATADALAVDPVLTTEIAINITETPATADALMVDPVLDVQINILVEETPATASSNSLDPSIIADKEFVFNALPAESNFYLLLPSWSPPPPAPLYTLPGSLRDKIATYPIEYGVEFGAKTGSPGTDVSVYGSRTISGTTTFQNFSSPVYTYSTDGAPASDANSYLLGPSNSESRQFYPYSSTLAPSIRPIWQDFNYTIGAWFKFDSLPTGTDIFAKPIIRIRTGATELTRGGEFAFYVSGSSNATSPSKFTYSFNNRSTSDPIYVVGPTLNTTDWYYLAIRRTSATNINNFEVYLNGQLVDTKTNTDTTVYHELQLNTGVNGYKIQNLHMATASALTPYEIGQIWLAGTTQEPATPVNAIYPPEPIYVNATIVDGTYIATRPDSVNVATSFPVDALMVLPAWSNATESRYSADVIELDATLGDNIGLDTFADKIVPSEALTATIDIVDPLLSRFAFAGSALFVDPVVSVAPNYLALVKNLDPVFYIQDGQSTPQQLGSWPVSGWQIDDMLTNISSGEEMTSVGNGKSWQAVSNFSGDLPIVRAIVPDYMQRRADLYATRSLSLEMWYYSLAAGTNAGTRVESGPLFTDGTTQIAEAFDFWGNSETGPASNTHLLIGDLIKNYDFVGEGANAYATWRAYYGQPKRNSWNHVVVTYEPLPSPTQVR